MIPLVSGCVVDWIVVLQISRKAASASPTGLHGTFPPLLGLA